jgi:hydrogenase small subunit
MNFTRRDFLRAAAALAASRSLVARGAEQLQQVLAGESNAPVVWLQGQACSGCSVSLLNSVYYTTIDDLLLNRIDLEFHATLMAGTGQLASDAAMAAQATPGYVLVVEGAIPTGASGKYCQLWPGMTMLNAVQTFSANAGWVLAVGACAAYGGIPGGSMNITVPGTPNPTGAVPVSGIIGTPSKLINIPGCPAHPDWIVGTILYLLEHGAAPALDANRRPTMFYGNRIHDYCSERRKHCTKKFANRLGEEGCLERVGCKGQSTYSDCYSRKWNSGAANTYGVNWCIGARTPCHGCVEPQFPDGMSPFFLDW